MRGEAARVRGARRWRLPAPRPRPVSRVIALRLGLYVLLVGLLVALHPLAPVPMLAVSSVLAVTIVAAQRRWRLPAVGEWDPQHLHLSILLTLVLIGAGMAIVIVGVDDAVPRDLESLHSVSLFLAVAMVFIGAGLFESMARREGGAWHPLSAAILVVLGVAYFAGLARLGTGWWSWVPLACLLAAPVFVGILSERRIGRRQVAWEIPRRGALLAVVGAGVAALVLAGLRAGGVIPWWTLWWGSSLLPFLFVLLLRPRRDLTSAGLLASGVAAGALPLVLVQWFGYPEPLVWLFPLVMATVLLIAVDNNTDVVFIVVLVAVAWSGLPRSVPPDAAMQVDGDDPVMVALGDSFMSGEGAKRYVEGTNRRARNECRRAPTAYPVLLARAAPPGGVVPERLAFLACSGARVEHLGTRPQFADEPPGGPAATPLQQVAQIDEEHGGEVGLALVSIGGNDAGFGAIARTCFAPGSCTELAERWRAPLLDPDRLPARLDEAFREIDAALAGVPIVVVPYPVPLEPRSCSDSTLTDAEHRFLHDITVELNATIEAAAVRAGFHYAQDVQWSLIDSGQALCGTATERGVNWVDLNPVGGSLAQTANPRNWLHNSLHPNEAGHATIAAALGRWLDEHVDPTRRPVPDPTRQYRCDQGSPDPGCPDERPADAIELPEACRVERTDDPDACERAWLLGHTSSIAAGPSVLMLVLVLAHWHLSVHLIAWWRAGTSPRPASSHPA